VAHVGSDGVQAEVVTMRCSSRRPVSLAAIWAVRSARFWSITTGPGTGGKQFTGGLLPKSALIHQQPVVDNNAFLLDATAVRRRRTGGAATDIGMMAAGTDQEEDLLPASFQQGVMTVTSGRWVPPL
jgi:hypothetical protein